MVMKPSEAPKPENPAKSPESLELPSHANPFQTKPKKVSQIGMRSKLIREALPGILITAFTGIVATVIVKLVTEPRPTSSQATTTPKMATGCKTFADCPAPPKGLFRYSGSTSWVPLHRELNLELAKLYPEFKMQYVAPETGVPGTVKGAEMLLEGKVDFSHSARPLSQEFRSKAAQQGQVLEMIPIAMTGFTVIVHPDVKIPGLTIKQLRDIYAGRIENWKQLGGDDLPIQSIQRTNQPDGTRELVLGDEPAGSNVQLVATPTEGVRKVSKTPGAVFYTGSGLLLNQCIAVRRVPIGMETGQFFDAEKAIGNGETVCSGQPKMRMNSEALIATNGGYPLKDLLYVTLVKNDRVQSQPGEVYANFLLSEQGQALIEKAGYARIR